jgi:hypothetical protein
MVGGRRVMFGPERKNEPLAVGEEGRTRVVVERVAARIEVALLDEDVRDAYGQRAERDRRESPPEGAAAHCSG